MQRHHVNRSARTYLVTERHLATVRLLAFAEDNSFVSNGMPFNFRQKAEVKRWEKTG
jgi:hypothetical protein